MLSVASAGQAEYLGTDRLAACLLKFSAMTWKIVVGIHWEALKLWLKGETSGHRLVVKEIATDCDRDAVLVRVEALGPGVCHEGYQSCFARRLEDGQWRIGEPRAYDPDAVYGGKP